MTQKYRMGVSNLIFTLDQPNLNLNASDQAGEMDATISNPSSGYCRIYGMYLDPATMNLIIEYESNPS